MRRPSIQELNRLDPREFTRAIATLFEHAPSFAARLAAARPFRSYEDVLVRGRAIARDMTESDQIALLDAHPRIGERPTVLSRASYAEQGCARERDADRDALSRVHRELAQLNDAYERKFGFRFVVFVAGRSKAEIRDVLAARLQRGRDEELRTGLDDVFAIAADRLRSMT